MRLFEQGIFVEEQRRIRKEIVERWERWFGKSNTTEEENNNLNHRRCLI